MGVTTVGLALVREVAVAARAPRMLYLHWPFGHALGEPNNRDQHRTILHDVFSMARTAPRPGRVEASRAPTQGGDRANAVDRVFTNGTAAVSISVRSRRGMVRLVPHTDRLSSRKVLILDGKAPFQAL